MIHQVSDKSNLNWATLKKNPTKAVLFFNSNFPLYYSGYDAIKPAQSQNVITRVMQHFVTTKHILTILKHNFLLENYIF